MNIESFAKIGSGGPFREVADDLVTFRQKPCAEFPSLPRWTATVSRGDIDLQKVRGRFQVPKRNAQGVLLRIVWDGIKSEAARDRFARDNGWPFTIHRVNLESAEEVAL